MCKFRLPNAIILDNGSQFTSIIVIDFYHELGVQTKFVSIIHPWANGQGESTNKVILKGIKKWMMSKGMWVELLHEILWSYHTTPYSTTKEIPVTMVYIPYVILCIEIDTPSWGNFQFIPKVNDSGLRRATDIICKIRDVSRIQEFAAKKRVFGRYNSKVMPREIHEGDLVLR